MYMDETSHIEGGLPVLCPRARFLSPTMNPVWRRGGKTNGAVEEPVDFQKWMTHSLQSRQTTYFFIWFALIVFYTRCFTGSNPTLGASCSLLYPQGFLSARVPQTLCDKRMFTPVMQNLQFLC